MRNNKNKRFEILILFTALLLSFSFFIIPSEVYSSEEFGCNYVGFDCDIPCPDGSCEVSGNSGDVDLCICVEDEEDENGEEEPATYFLGTTAGPNGSINPSGTNEYDAGKTVHIIASANEGYEVSHWNDACADKFGDDYQGSNCFLEMNRDKNTSVAFQLKEYQFSLNAARGGTTNPSPDPDYYHKHGDTVSVQAIPDDGYSFDRWGEGGACEGQPQNCSFVITQQESTGAYFEKKSYSISCNVGDGEGSTGGNCGTSVDHGDSATVTASPATGYEFSHWSGNASGTSTSYTFNNVTSNRSATANFVRLPTTSADPDERDWDNEDVEVTVSATDHNGLEISNIYACWTTESSCEPAEDIMTSEDEGTTTQSETGIWTLCHRARSDSGNLGEEDCDWDYKIDKEDPTGSVDIKGSDWTNSPITVQITGQDDYSGVKEIKYCWAEDGDSCNLDDNVEAGDTVNATIDETGRWNLYFKIYDNAGNSSLVYTRGLYKIDKETPNTNVEPTSRSWNNTSVDVSISANDGTNDGTEGSGVDRIYYCWEKEGNCNPADGYEGDLVDDTINVSKSDTGQWHLCHTAYDGAGNSSSGCNYEYRIDKETPVISLDPEPTGEWKAKSEFQVTVNASDGEGGSGISQVRYHWNDNSFNSSCTSGGTPISNNSDISAPPGENTLYLCVRDGAGNTAERNETYRWNPPPTAGNLRVTEYTDEDYCNYEPYPPGYTLFWDYEKPTGSTAEYAESRIQFENKDNPAELSIERDYENVEMVSPSELAELDFNTTYQWRVKVWDENGLESEWSSYHEFTTGIRRPVVKFSWVPLHPFEEEKVHFTNETIKGDEDIIGIEWDFGENADPEDSTEDDPEVKFTDDGLQPVTLTVTDEGDVACYKEKTVGVRFELPDWKEVGPVGLQMLFLSLNF